MLETIAKMHREQPNAVAVWLESENSLTFDYVVQTFGIDPERFFFIEHEKDGGAETAGDILGAILETGCSDLVCVNSLKCLVPKTELGNSLEKDTIALQARFNSKLIKKFTALTQEHDTAFVLISHLTTTIGSMSRDPLVIAGGRAIAYASMLTLDMRKASIQESDPIKKEDGLKIKVTCRKNHCVCNKFPYGAVEYYVKYGEGVAWELELLEAAIDNGIIVTKGAWVYEMDAVTGETAVDDAGNALKWNGKNAFKLFIAENEWYRERLEAMINGTFAVEALSDSELADIQSDDVNPSDAVKAYDPDATQDPIKASRKK